MTLFNALWMTYRMRNKMMDRRTQCTIKVRSDEMRSRFTLLSAFGSAACAREYMSDNARCYGVRRRLMTLMGPERTSVVRIYCSNAISRHFNT
ncbi:hypothetical protein J6590_029538 [Homalodisca vitripennis]|nr:hypothetical protein J6590_029538 [Homalodisca vitripennis]